MLASPPVSPAKQI